MWTSEEVQLARALYAGGDQDVSTIARMLGVSRASVYRALRAPREAGEGP